MTSKCSLMCQVQTWLKNCAKVQNTLQQVLEQREEAHQSKQLLELYLQTLEKEGSILSKQRRSNPPRGMLLTQVLAERRTPVSHLRARPSLRCREACSGAGFLQSAFGGGYQGRPQNTGHCFEVGHKEDGNCSTGL